jgi:UTP--glucose-1-phosphate uridylyltransferase
MTIRKAIIPAAGLGTRLHPATRSQPKEMLPLGRKPTIQLVVEEVVAAGVREILIVTGAKKRAIEDHFDQADELGIDASFYFTRQSQQLGLGDAVHCGREFVGDDPFVVALGDCVITGDGSVPLLSRLLAAHRAAAPAATIAVQQVPPDRISSYGIVAPQGRVVPAPADADQGFEISDIVEKPQPEHAPSDLAVTARYVLEPIIFDYLAGTRPGLGGEVQLTDALRCLLGDGHPIRCVLLAPDEFRYDVGSFESYWKAFAALMVKDQELGPRLRAFLRELAAEHAPLHTGDPHEGEGT